MLPLRDKIIKTNKDTCHRCDIVLNYKTWLIPIKV